MLVLGETLSSGIERVMQRRSCNFHRVAVVQGVSVLSHCPQKNLLSCRIPNLIHTFLSTRFLVFFIGKPRPSSTSVKSIHHLIKSHQMGFRNTRNHSVFCFVFLYGKFLLGRRERADGVVEVSRWNLHSFLGELGSWKDIYSHCNYSLP